jgi:hypothetical protein
MKVRLAEWAPEGPPETGASMKRWVDREGEEVEEEVVVVAAVVVTRLWMEREVAVSIVEHSTKRIEWAEEGSEAERRPVVGLLKTSFTSTEVGSIVMIMDASSAISRGVLDMRTKSRSSVWARNLSVCACMASQMMSLDLRDIFARRLRAIGDPMFPKSMKP